MSIKTGLCGLIVAVIAATGCASTTPYVSNELETPLAVTPTPFHQVTYVRVHEKNGKLVVYGKVRHEHDFCEAEGHVDLVVEGRDGVQTASLPLLRQSKRRLGWYGAGFRAQLDVASAPTSIRLTFHEAGCHVGDTFDCGDNRARAVNPPTVGADS